MEAGGGDRTHLLGPDPWHLKAGKELNLGPDQLVRIFLPPWDFGQVSTPASVTVSPPQNEDVPTCQEASTGSVSVLCSLCPASWGAYKGSPFSLVGREGVCRYHPFGGARIGLP